MSPFRTLHIELYWHMAFYFWKLREPSAQGDAVINTHWNDCKVGALHSLDYIGIADQKSHEFLMQIDEIRIFLEATISTPQYPLNDCIVDVFGLLADYDDKLTTEKIPFQVESDYSTLMSAFVACGFAMHGAEGYSWTEKMTPIMIQGHFWDSETNECMLAQQKVLVQDLADRVWAAIPDWRRHILKQQYIEKSNIEAACCIFRYWDGKQFLLTKIENNAYEEHMQDAATWSLAGIEIARRLKQF